MPASVNEEFHDYRHVNVSPTQNIKPLKAEFILNSIYKFSSYLTENILCLLYKDQSVNAVRGNNRCLWEPYGTHKYTLGAECRVLVC
jgi:hypothetical protein